MQSASQYLYAVLRHWVALLTSSIPIAVLFLVQGITGWQPPGWMYAAAAAVFLLLAPFLAWKETSDRLNALLDRKAVADFLAQILIETNHWWQTGCQVPPIESAAAKWCAEYDPWMVGLKERVRGRLGQTEETAIFQIGPGLIGVESRVGVTIEQQRRMACLKLHMEELKEAIKAYR